MTVDDALSGRYGPIVVRYGYEDRDHAYRFRHDITEAVVSPAPRLSLDNTRAALRTLTLNLNIERLPIDFDIHSMSVHICPFIEVLIDGEWERFNLGMFHIDRMTHSHKESATEVRADCIDLSYHLLETTPEAYTVAAGTAYMQAIQSILGRWHLHNMLPEDTTVLPITATWPPFTPWVNIVNDLAFGCGYLPPWSNSTGQFVTRKKVPIADGVSDVVYRDTVEPRMIDANSAYEESDIRHSSLPNQWAVLIDDPAHPDFGGYTRRNITEASIVSAASRNVDAKESKGEGNPSTRAMLDSATAIEAADWFLSDAESKSHPATLRTFTDPRRGAHEYYTLDIAGVESNSLWRVLSWDLMLEEGALMTHQITRALPIVAVPVIVQEE